MPLLLILAALAVVWVLIKGTTATAGAASQVQPGAGPLIQPPQNDFGTGQQIGDYSPVTTALQSMMNAIFRQEGDKPGDLAARNNNPGNLRYGPDQVGKVGGFAQFADLNTGFNDLSQYISTTASAHPSWNFYDFFTHYLGGDPDKNVPAPGDQGNAAIYAENVANALGVPPTSTVANVIGS